MWVPCVKRQEIVQLNPDGSTQPLARCTHKACVMFNKDLQVDDCAQCPLRVFTEAIRPPGYQQKIVNERDFGQPKILADGTLVYPMTGIEPPVVPEGYVRKSEDIRSEDAWAFIPTWPPCQDREMANSVRPCGCIQIGAMCASKESNRYGLDVLVQICHDCPVRRP